MEPDFLHTHTHSYTLNIHQYNICYLRGLNCDIENSLAGSTRNPNSTEGFALPNIHICISNAINVIKIKSIFNQNLCTPSWSIALFVVSNVIKTPKKKSISNHKCRSVQVTKKELFLQMQTRIWIMCLLYAIIWERFFDFVHGDVWWNAWMCLWISCVVYIEMNYRLLKCKTKVYNERKRRRRRRKQRNEFEGIRKKKKE